MFNTKFILIDLDVIRTYNVTMAAMKETVNTMTKKQNVTKINLYVWMENALIPLTSVMDSR